MVNEKIELVRDGGPVVFLGTMNAMPMMYALELKKKGIEVIYFVDVPPGDKLSRPESHYSGIDYPYPEWIVELILKTQILVPFFSSFYLSKIKKIIKDNTDKEPQAYILSGFFITLAPHFSKKSYVVALPHGSDMDSWADIEGLGVFAESFRNYSIFKYMPKFLALKAIEYLVCKQFYGFKAVDKVLYYPKGFNSNGDRVANKLLMSGVNIHERYDISFEPIINQSREYKAQSDKIVIFSGVRFSFETFSEGNKEYNKGNDIIIDGIARFYRSFKNIEVHFVEKGPDIDKAKSLCREYGIDNIVIWHKEMAFKELLALYSNADICFDQVGSHWIGAIGAYALWLGKPLIANDYLPVKTGFWPDENPVCSASSPEDISSCLHKLASEEYRIKLSFESKRFAESYFSPMKIINEVFFIYD